MLREQNGVKKKKHTNNSKEMTIREAMRESAREELEQGEKGVVENA